MRHTDPVVRHLPHQSRFEVWTGGDRAVSWLEYEPVVGPRGTVWRLLHTVTLPAERGKGLASGAVAHVLATAAVQGVRVEPVCSFVRDWLARNPQHAHVVVEA